MSQPAVAAEAGPAVRGTLVFSHANGFPAGTYARLFAIWRAAGWRVLAIDKYGHDPKYPVASNWVHQRDELIHFIERDAEQRGHEPVCLVGHSLGGFLSLMAASRRPDLARAVVMLDSPVLGPVLSRTVQFFKATGWGERFSPGRISKRRRQQWPSADAALAHFASKPAFARWEPGVLQDYIDCGMQADEQGARLAFRREVETQLYNTLPHHIGRLLQRHPLQCPLAFVAGTASTEVKQVGLTTVTRLAEGRVSWLDGSHLYPFERPVDTAAEVLRWLDRIAAPHPLPNTL
jgi:pimeloyl-ACP methyl ester carboxylesterase